MFSSGGSEDERGRKGWILIGAYPPPLCPAATQLAYREIFVKRSDSYPCFHGEIPLAGN